MISGGNGECVGLACDHGVFPTLPAKRTEDEETNRTGQRTNGATNTTLPVTEFPDIRKILATAGWIWVTPRVAKSFTRRFDNFSKDICNAFMASSDIIVDCNRQPTSKFGKPADYIVSAKEQLRSGQFGKISDYIGGTIIQTIISMKNISMEDGSTAYVNSEGEILFPIDLGLAPIMSVDTSSELLMSVEQQNI